MPQQPGYKEEIFSSYNLIDLFDNQVKINSSSIAISSTVEIQNIYDKLTKNDIDIHITYEQLGFFVNKLAIGITNIISSKNNLIGMMIEHPIKKVIAIFGILKSGNAYVPLDYTYPATYISDILKDSDINVILTEERLFKKYSDPFRSKTIINIDEIKSNEHEVIGSTDIMPDDLAYVVYTSGSTGKAKGIAVEHRGILNYVKWRIKHYEVDKNSVIMQLYSYNFDSFCSNFYSTIFGGGHLIIVPDNKRVDYEYIVKIIQKYNVTNFCCPPIVFDIIMETARSRQLDSLTSVVLAGDIINKEIIEKCSKRHPNIKMYNEYGPTETSVAATCCSAINPLFPNNIGIPIDNTEIFIMNDMKQEVQDGDVGEIYIAGAGVSKGYVNNTELTNNKFVIIANNKRNIRAFATGDYGKWIRSENNIKELEFIGRVDNQVKIRGFRIEIEQVESILSNFKMVEKAIVVEEKNNSYQYLAAYIIPKNIDYFKEEDIKTYLRKKLPNYMIPSKYYIVDKIPYTDRGKVDRRAIAIHNTLKKANDYIATTDTERQIIKIIKDILEIDNIHIDDNLFEIGCDSLMVFYITAELEAAFNIGITVDVIYSHCTIRKLNDYLRTQNIFCQVHYIPVHTLPYYKALGWKNGDFPMAENYYNHCLSLPMYPTLTDEEQNFVIEKITHFLNG